MSLNEVKSVKNFKIWNDFGKIEWEGVTDLLEVNLDQDVHIKPMCIELYPDDIYLNERKKPTTGQKLNKECIVTLYNVRIPEELSASKFVRRLQMKCRKINCQFLDYDEKMMIWKFKLDGVD